MSRFKFFNVRGDLFATGVQFSAQTGIKLISSLVLTRILEPSAYGTIAILMSVVAIFVLLSDIGFSVCIVRSVRGEDPSYLNTAWTMRIARAVVNASILFLAAPLIAELYHAPLLTAPFRVLSVWFLIDGFESTAFPLAIRRRNSRVYSYSELLGSFVAAIVSLVYCYFSRDFWGMLYGVIVNRLVVVIMSHRFYRELRPRIQWDWASAKEIFQFTRVVMPSSILTLFLNQFDRAVFLRLFDFRLLGIYSLAANIATPVESLIGRASQVVLYPRCAHNFRTDPHTFPLKYYLENTKLFIATLAIPAALGGAAHLVITTLYDPRYADAAAVLQAWMVRAVIKAFHSPAERMLIATGENRLVLVANVYRVIWIVGVSLLGYQFFGFLGFTYGVALSGIPALVYYWWLQHRKGMLIMKYELYKIGFSCGVATCTYFASSFIMILLPALGIKV
ncbi:MAG TPA: oligosaccharide flippase family protein [Steroidobacteraceae bacterium]|nr:oligosaccharide flippase family protein [Steroidobacteraceae bacterium]